ncbi:AraC family transcriptional regulator [Hydrogenophaga palleronii]|uniref:AraC family transcriptional regulator n=1 Tax=Hydrogenophaga palleronii TaxID=65655 RepID=UPI0008265AD0|nr:AraC family transcriptional regulator [Hydrogenophaga palleronii]
MDVLSEVLAICRAERAVTARFHLSAPWGLHSNGVSGAAMIRMARGAPWWVEAAGGNGPLRVEPGDLVMMPLGAAHRMGSAPDAPTVPFAQLLTQRTPGARDEAPLDLQHGGGGEGCEMFSALLWFSAYCRHSVLSVLPPLIHVRASELPTAVILAASMETLVTETLDQRPGWRLSASRMGELLLINILRGHLLRHGTGSGTEEANWWRGLSDPAIARAIAAMHRDPARSWTVETLAREAAMSRSRFSDRFKTLVGDTPMGYLGGHRMALAAEQLEAGHLPLAQVAQDAGYESDKVFARAFRRWSGLSPTAYARQEAARRAAMTEPHIASGGD